MVLNSFYVWKWYLFFFFNCVSVQLLPVRCSLCYGSPGFSTTYFYFIISNQALAPSFVIPSRSVRTIGLNRIVYIFSMFFSYVCFIPFLFCAFSIRCQFLIMIILILYFLYHRFWNLSAIVVWQSRCYLCHVSKWKYTTFGIPEWNATSP